jgi:hypothetical protein
LSFEEQNKVLETSIIIVNYSITIIGAYCNFIVKLMHGKIIIVFYNKGPFLEYDKKENVEVVRLLLILFEEKFLKCFVSCHVFNLSLPGRRPNGKYPVNTLYPS